MKLIKLSIFVLALGLFASCNDKTTTSDEMPPVDTPAMAPPAETPPVAPAMQGAAPADSNMKPAGEMPKADMPN